MHIFQIVQVKYKVVDYFHWVLFKLKAFAAFDIEILKMDVYVIKEASNKGCLFSESFSFWLKSPKMGAKSLPWASYFVEGSDLACIFGDMSQREKVSEIKLSL